jgi:hypothetical protein
MVPKAIKLPIHVAPRESYSWQGNLAAAALLFAAVFVVNTCLVWKSDKGFGIWLWILVFVPLVNLLLMLLSISFRHLVRRLFAARTSSYVTVAVCACGMAVIVDTLAILIRAMK